MQSLIHQPHTHLFMCHCQGCHVALFKIPDTGSSSGCGTQFLAIDTCIVQYYYHFYTEQRTKIPDSPVKYQTIRLNTGHLATLVTAFMWNMCDCLMSTWFSFTRAVQSPPVMHFQ